MLPLNWLGLLDCFSACISAPPIPYALAATATTGSLSFLSIRSVNPASNLRLPLTYLHLVSFMFLITTLSLSMVCGMLFLNPLLPAALLLVFIGIALTYVLAPKLYLSSLGARETRDGKLSEWTEAYSKLMGTKTPTLYLTERARPIAFSTHGMKPKICVSSLILEKLSPEEIKAILIHEIAHIMMKTQVHKVCLSFLRFLTPFSLIHSFPGELQSAESRADEYVRTIQGTSEFVEGARDKVVTF